MHRQARPHLGLKTQPSFCPVSLSLSKEGAKIVIGANSGRNNVMFGLARLGWARLGYVRLGCAVLCWIRLGYTKIG